MHAALLWAHCCCCSCSTNEIRSFLLLFLFRFFFLFLIYFFFLVRSFVISFQSIFHSFTTIVIAQASKILYVCWLKHHTHTLAFALHHSCSRYLSRWNIRISRCISFCYSTIFKEYNFLFCAMFSRNGFCLERKCAFHYRENFTKRLNAFGIL